MHYTHKVLIPTGHSTILLHPATILTAVKTTNSSHPNLQFANYPLLLQRTKVLRLKQRSFPLTRIYNIFFLAKSQKNTGNIPVFHCLSYYLSYLSAYFFFTVVVFAADFFAGVFAVCAALTAVLAVVAFAAGFFETCGVTGESFHCWFSPLTSSQI